MQVPFADMFNTDTPKNTYWHYDSARKGFVVEAHRDIQPGEQLFDTYGIKCNYRYFLYYGFVKSGNHEHNEYHIKIKLQKSDPEFYKKVQFFSFDSCQKFKLQGNLKTPEMLHFLSWMRFIVFEGDIQLLKKAVLSFEQKNRDNTSKWVQEIFEKKQLFVPAFDIHNEMKVWERIKDIMVQKMCLYETSIEEDQKILESDSNNLSFNQRNCISLRMEDKIILRYFIGMAEYIQRLFAKFQERMDKDEVIKVIVQDNDESCKGYLLKKFVPLL